MVSVEGTVQGSELCLRLIDLLLGGSPRPTSPLGQTLRPGSKGLDASHHWQRGFRAPWSSAPRACTGAFGEHENGPHASRGIDTLLDTSTEQFCLQYQLAPAKEKPSAALLRACVRVHACL